MKESGGSACGTGVRFRLHLKTEPEELLTEQAAGTRERNQSRMTARKNKPTKYSHDGILLGNKRRDP